jgi:plastocyanin
MKMKILSILLVLLAIQLSWSCNKSSSPYGNNNNTGGNANSNAVNISGMAFSASSITVTKGTKVTWTNNDNMTHTVSADDNTFDSGDMGNSATFSHVFNTVGTFNYHCKYHSSMTGSVIVK